MTLGRSLLLAALCLGACADVARADAPVSWRDRPTVTPGDDGGRHAAAPDLARQVEGGPVVEPEDVALAGPRVVLAVPRLIATIALTPVHAIAYVVGRYRVPERVVDILYNDERTAAVLPYVTFLGRQGATLGVSAFHAGLGKHHERVSVGARFGGVYQQAYSVAFAAPAVAGTPLLVEAESVVEIQTGEGFWGLGVRPRDDGLRPSRPLGPRDVAVATQLEQRRYLTRLRAAWALPDVQVGLIGAFVHRDFDPSRMDDDIPSIERIYDVDRLVGFERGFTLIEPLANVVVDTRAPAGRPSSGLRLDVFGGGPPPQRGAIGYLHYGASLTGYIDLYAGDRILVLHAAHESVIGPDGAIPFAELPRLGGPRRLRGYERNRFRDEQTLLAVAQYEYPIHEYVDGAVFVEMGSLGRDYAELVDPEQYRFSVGGALLFRSQDTRLLSLQIGYGEGVQVFITTDPFVTFQDKAGEP